MKSSFNWLFEYGSNWLRNYIFKKQKVSNLDERSPWLDINQKLDECIGKDDLESAIIFAKHALQEARRFFGKDHDKTGISHYVLGTLYVQTGQKTLAQRHLQQAWKIHKKLSTDEGWKLAPVTFQTLLNFYSTNKQQNKTEGLFFEGIEAWEKVLSRQNDTYYNILKALSKEYACKGAHAKAEKLLVSKLELAGNKYGSKNSLYGCLLGRLGLLYLSWGRPIQAIANLEKSVAFLERQGSDSSPDYASFLSTLFHLYTVKGEHARAGEIYHRVLNRAGSFSDLKNADVFQKISQTLWDAGNFGKAQPLLEQLVEIYYVETQKDHPDDIPVNRIASLDLGSNKLTNAHCPYIEARRMLANLHIVLGEYQSAAYIYSDIWKMNRTIFGLKNPDLVFYVMGDMGSALFGKRSCNPAWKTDPDVLNYIESLGTAARLFFAIGDYSSSSEVVQAAYTYSESVLGKQHPLYLQSLNAYAQMEISIGNPNAAFKHYQECVQTSLAILGDKSPIFREAVTGLAGVFDSCGMADQALKWYKLVLTSFDENNPLDTFSIYKLNISIAKIYTNSGNKTEAIRCFLKSASLFDKLLSHIMAYGYNQRLEEYIASYQSLYHMLFSLFVRNQHELSDFIERTYGVLLKRKAVILEWAAQKKIHIQRGKYPIQDELFSKLKKLQEDFASQLNCSRFFPLLADMRKYQSNEEYTLNHCAQEIRNIEKLLNARLPQYATISGIRQISMEEVISKLPDGYVLIDYVYYKTFEAVAGEPERDKIEDFRANIMDYWMFGSDKKTAAENFSANFDHYQEMVSGLGIDLKEIASKLGLDDPELASPKREPVNGRYAAFIVRKDQPRLQVVDIGESSYVENLITSLREEISVWGEARLKKQNEVGRKEPGTFFTETAYALSQTLFTPVLSAINGLKKMLISADGALFEFPFEILPLPGNRYLIEEYDVHYIDAARDLVNFDDTALAQSPPLIVADPDFDLCDSSPSQEASTFSCRPHSTDGPRYAERIRSCFDDDWPGFRRLNGAREEGRYVHELLGPGAVLLQGNQALKSKLIQIRSPHILHIATHGFVFQGDRSQEGKKRGLWFGQFHNPESEFSEITDNPLLRSGLLLAGANTFLRGKPAAPGAEEGILTAVDISVMNMVGTDLVVLSACSTGLGEVKPGEGIFGMRRAFALAGARSLLVSLWSVPDQETKRLLSRFYNGLNRGLSKTTALKEAKLAMISDLRKRQEADHPYTWGAFICVGNPGPLEKFPP